MTRAPAVRIRLVCPPVFVALALLLNNDIAFCLDPAKAITQYAHQVWTTQDGIPQNSVRAFAQTNDGYLWLATQAGLARFDGVQFTVFDHSNTKELRNDHILALLAARD